MNSRDFEGYRNNVPRINWPNDAQLAVSIVVNIEEGAELSIGNGDELNEHIYEVDIFEGDNINLIVAEIELTSENETFKKPEWLGKEVTGDIKYYNSNLSKNPFKNWSV